MKVLAQSQQPAKLSYIHLAYISAQLSRSVSKSGFSTGGMLAAVLAIAVTCGAVGGWLRKGGRHGRLVNNLGTLGLLGGTLMVLLTAFAWGELRSKESLVKHVVQTRQFWALRDESLAAAVEAAAVTNGAAAALAADYYSRKFSENAPELIVKGFRFSELATAQGSVSRWSRFEKQDFLFEEAFKAALKTGRLSEADKEWATQRLARMANESR